jgi:cell division protein FtsB
MSKRIQDLISENKTLKAQVKDLEAGWKKIEKAFGTEVSRAKRVVRRRARSATKKVGAAINAAKS